MMQMISEVMTRNVQFVSPHESLQRAAQMMDELNVGALPVCDGERLVGMVTDRDITVRATAAGRAPTEAHVEEVMSTDVRWCFEDQDIDEVMRQMSDTQIRRVPVVSHDDAHRLVGIVSLGDLATKATGNGKEQQVEQVVEKISTPSEPDRSERGNGAAMSAADDGSNVATGSGAADDGPDTGNMAGRENTEVQHVGSRDRGDIGLAGGIGNPAGVAAGNPGAAGGMGNAGGAGATPSGSTASTSGSSIPRAGEQGGAAVGGELDIGSDRDRADDMAIATPAGAAGSDGANGSKSVAEGTGAPAGSDVAGAVGASGGTAGTGGSAGTGVGARP